MGKLSGVLYVALMHGGIVPLRAAVLIAIKLAYSSGRGVNTPSGARPIYSVSNSLVIIQLIVGGIFCTLDLPVCLR